MDEYKGIYFNETNELKFYEGGAHFRYVDLVNVLEDIKAKNVFKQRNAKSMTAVHNKHNNEGIIINSGSNCKMKYQSRNIHPLIQSLTQKLSEITNKQKQEEIHINKKAIGNNNNSNNNKLLIVHQRQTSKIDNNNNVNSSSCVSNNDIKHKASRNQIKNGNVINSINTCNTALTLGKNTINKQMWKKTICSNTNNNNNNNNHPIVNKIKVNYSISESQYNFQKKSTTMIINNERSRNKQLQQHQHHPSHQIIHPNNHPKTSLLHLTKTNPTHKDVFIQNLSFIKPTSTVIHKKHTPDKRRNKSIGDITVNRDKAYLNHNNSCNSNSNNTNNIKMDNSTITNSHHHNQRTFSMHNEISLLSSDLNTSNRGSTTVIVHNNNNNNNDKHSPFNINQINTVNNNNNNIIVKPRINISFVNNINTKSRNKTANKNHSNGKTINVNRDATRLHGGGGVSNKYNTLFKTNHSLKGICSVNGNNSNSNNKAVSPLCKGKKRVVSGVKMNYHGKSNSGYGGNNNNVNMNMNMNRNDSDVGKVSIEFEILAKGMKGNYTKLSEITLKRKKKDL